MIRALAMVAILGAAPASAQTWDFRVLLDGTEIGRHTFTAEAQGGSMRVVSVASFEVRFLFVSAYRYAHRAEETWHGDCLVTLRTRTETNGQRQTVRLRSEGNGWRVERDGAVDTHHGCLKTFAYWNPGIVAEPSLLNAQTGELLPVRSTALGTERIAVRGAPLEASRHRLTAPGLSIDLWYAGQDWVALESALEGGRRLRYERL